MWAVTLVFVVRWQIGPEFDVDVPAWTGTSTGTLTPPPEERNVSPLLCTVVLFSMLQLPHLGSVRTSDRIILVLCPTCNSPLHVACEKFQMCDSMYVPQYVSISQNIFARYTSDAQIQAVQRQLDEQQEWSSDRAAAPFEPETLTKYLNTAKVLAPILPGTIVYITPHANGLWGDGHDPKHARPNGAVSGSAGFDGPIAGAEGAPRLSSASRSKFRWGLVSEGPSPEQLQLGQEQARRRGGGAAVGGASNVGMTQRAAARGAGVEMPMASQPQWFTQQQQQQQLGTGMQQQQHLGLMQHQLGMPYQLAMPYHHQQQHALCGNANNFFQPQLPANSLLRQEWLQHGAPDGNFTNPSLVARGRAPGLAPIAYANPPAPPSSVPNRGRGAGVERTIEGPVVWIANPVEGKPPLQVERARVFGREFEEEAMNVLWDARG